MTGSISSWSVAPMLTLTWGGGVIAGFLLAHLYLRLTAAVRDIPISILMQFISTFAVWILAERIGVSAIITVVCYAMTLARHAPARMDAPRRIASFAVWDVAGFFFDILSVDLFGGPVVRVPQRTRASGRAAHGRWAAARGA